MPYDSRADFTVEIVNPVVGGASVQGPVADGAAQTGNPVPTGGVDGSGNAQHFLVDTSGRQVVVGAVADGGSPAGLGIIPIAGLSQTSGLLNTLRLDSMAADNKSKTLQVVEVSANLAAYRGSNSWDRVVTANTASNTTGTGLLGAGNLLFDGTNWQTLRQVGSADGAAVGVLAGSLFLRESASVFNASSSVAAAGDGNTAQRSLSTGLNNFNETTYDRGRANTDVTVLASASRTTTQTVTFTNYNSTFLRVVLDMTVVGTGSVTLSIEALDTVSGKWTALLTGAAVITNVTNVYTVGPALPVTANVSANQMLSRFMRIVVTANNANPATYSCGRQLTGW